jgi:hypothetical protein
MANRCGFFQTSLTRKSDGEVAELSTECKEAQRLLYLELRRRAPRTLLREAEDLAERLLTEKPKEEEKKPHA